MDNNNAVEFLKLVLKIMASMFGICMLLLVIIQFFPSVDNSNHYNAYNGQKFVFQGNGEIALEGEDCMIVWKDENVSVTEKDDFGVARVVVSINGQREGELLTHSLKGCTIRVHNLKTEFKSNLLLSELAPIFITSALLTTQGTSVVLILFYLTRNRVK